MSSAEAPIVLVRTGTANLASVRAAFARAGRETLVSDDPAVVREAALAVLPGVGAFGAALEALRATGSDLAVADRVATGRPLLCVCLGLQLLFESSEETPGVRGLAVLPGHVARFPDAPGLVVPHFGWNAVTPGGRGTIEAGHAYYANSYRVAAPGTLERLRAEGVTLSTTDHGGPFVGALQRGPLLACQFHPELSGPWGQALLERWIDDAEHREATR